MKIALLIPVHNNLNYTMVSLNQLKEEIKIHDEIKIVVIDDGSTDGTSEYLKSNFDEIHLLKGDGNLWWSGAINKGAKFAIEELNADYLLLWNNDISYKTNYFNKLIEILKTANSNSIIGSKIMIQENPQLIWSMGGYFNPRNGQYYMHGFYKSDSEKYNQITRVDWLTGMGTIIPKSVIHSVGYWDNENFPQYHGDSDFTYRAKMQGFNIMVNHELILYNKVKNSGLEHKGSLKQLFKMITDLRSKSNFEKKLKFYRRHSNSLFAYAPLFKSYFKLFGGFLKWKILSIFIFKGIENNKR